MLRLSHRWGSGSGPTLETTTNTLSLSYDGITWEEIAEDY